MFGTGSPRTEPPAPVCAFGAAALQRLLSADCRKQRELVPRAFDRRAVHSHAFLRQSAHDRLAPSRGVSGQPQTGSAPDASDGYRGYWSQAGYQPAPSRARHLSLSARRLSFVSGQSSLERRYYLLSLATGIHVPGGHHRLVQPLRAQLATVQYPRYPVLSPSPRSSFGARQTQCFQHRSGLSVHQSGFHRQAQDRGYSHQYGWPGTGFGQRLRRETVAQCQVRVPVFARLRLGSPATPESGRLLPFLQPPALSSVAGLPNASCGALRVRAMKPWPGLNLFFQKSGLDIRVHFTHKLEFRVSEIRR